MSARIKRPAALKHAGYSETAVLPGESQTEFNKLRQRVFEDLKPEGPVEEDIVVDIVRLLWRKQNLETYRVAAAARARHEEIKSEFRSAVPPLPEYRLQNDLVTEEMEEEHAAAIQQAEENSEIASRKELGPAYVFVEHGMGNYGKLNVELEIGDRLQSAIERCFKRLLHVRGFKSLAVSPADSNSNVKRLSSQRTVA